MKNSTRLLIAIALTLVMAVGAVSVWAGSARQGTVPIFPEEFKGSCGENATINFGSGTVTGFGVCELVVTVSPDPGEAGALPEGWAGLFDYVSVTVASGTAEGIEACTPLSPDWVAKKAGETLNWFVWADGKWVEAETTIEQGSPELVCGYSQSEGIFTLLGK
jgi:hypothetical protein